MKERIKAIRKLMNDEGLEALLIDSAVNRFYLTGFTGTSGRVLFTPEANYFITDFRYTEQARKEIKGYQIKEFNKDVVEKIGKLLVDEGVKEIGFESKEVTVHKRDKYRDKFPDIKLTPTEDLVAGLRLYKDENEIKRIKKAIEITEKAFNHILDFIEPGKTEREIALELEFIQKKLGGEKNSFSFIVASGERSAMPHGVASNKVIKKNELITMDFGTVYKGYCSDMTRTVVVGKADSKQREIYNTVLKAQTSVIEEIKPGMTGKEADALGRDIIKDAGYGDNFGHGLGHGLGIEIHEEPRVSYKSDKVLKPGMIVTDEPGIYIPDWGGVRIEDDLLITETGCEVLNTAPKELIEL